MMSRTISRSFQHVMMFVILQLSALPCLASGEEPLVAWFKMREVVQDGDKRQIADSSGNSRNLTLGDGCWLTNNIIGEGLFFDGTASAWSTFDCPPLGNRTVSMLFYREEGNGPLLEGISTYPYIIDDYSKMRIHLTTGNNNAYLYVANSATISSGSFSRGAWHHLAWVYEESETADPNVVVGQCRFYCDGILEVTTPQYTLTNTSSAGITFLGSSRGRDRPVFGILNEVKLYREALSELQIREEMVRGMNSNAQLLGYWNMDAVNITDNGMVMYDMSGNNLDLQVGEGCQLVPGIDGNALNFNGSKEAYTFFTNCPAVSSWSFAGWIRQDSASAIPVIEGNIYPRVLHGTKGSLFFHMGPNSNNLTFQGYGHASSQMHPLRPAGDVWAHYAIINRLGYNVASNMLSTTPEFYVNGEKIATGQEGVVSRLMWVTGGTMYFGNNNPNGTRAFMGDFDDFRFYRGVLSDKDIRAIYQGAPLFSAGLDFSVSARQTTLRGTATGLNSIPPNRGISARTFWSLVSAPVGGEDAFIETPQALLTKVTLPVTGEYVFRLTATNTAFAYSDDVTITSLPEPSSNQSPTVTLNSTETITLPAPLELSATISDPDNAPGTPRVMWSKASGPGGVYFDDAFTNPTHATFLAAGEYVLRCTVEDGLDAVHADVVVAVSGENPPIEVSEGLAYYYPVNTPPLNREAVTGSTAMSVPLYTNGVWGYGMRSPNANDYCGTKQLLPENGNVNEKPTDITHLSFSFWMFHDSTDTNISAEASIVNVNYTLALFYGCQNDRPGFTMFQQGPGGATTRYFFPSAAVSTKDRWAHVYACFDRAEGSVLELYIDGLKHNHTNYAGKISGRVRNNDTIYIGGMVETSGGPQGPITNSVNGGFYSRVFPGIIDEMRIYRRNLTEAEIARLAAGPVWHNREPLPEINARSFSGYVGETLSLDATVYDDLLPRDSQITYQWHIVSDGETGIVLADSAEPTAQVELREPGLYAVQLEVSDGERVAFSPIATIRINIRGTLLLIR